VIARAQTDPWKRILSQELERMKARAVWQQWFRSHDVFLLPVVFTTAIPHLPTGAPIPTSSGERPYLDLLWWIASASLTGCPATVAPIGVTRDGLPVGIQIMGPYHEDATPIRFAAGLEAVVGGYRPPAGFS
jgi:amidase